MFCPSILRHAGVDMLRVAAVSWKLISCHDLTCFEYSIFGISAMQLLQSLLISGSINVCLDCCIEDSCCDKEAYLPQAYCYQSISTCVREPKVSSSAMQLSNVDACILCYGKVASRKTQCLSRVWRPGTLELQCQGELASVFRCFFGPLILIELGRRYQQSLLLW